jgi:DNA polymerase III subunit beta
MQLLERVEALTGEHSVLLPRKAMNAYQALAGLDEQGEVEIGIDPNHVYFRLGAHLLTTRLLSGQFPNYELVLPKSREITLRLQTWRLLPIIKRVLLMADSKSKSLRLEIKDKALHLSSEAADVGRGEDVLPLEIEAPPMVMGLNGKYLLDWLAGVETDELEILIKDEKSQIEGRPVGEQAWDSRYVLMPMRL